MQIQQHYNIRDHNTFHLDCIADNFVEITNILDLQDLLQNSLFINSPRLILGGGSNILLTQDSFSGLVIKNNILGKQIIEETDTTITIKVGGGENRDAFVRWALEQGYCGLENLVSIPGTVGAAPIQNIGAYGIEVASCITQVETIYLTPEKLGTTTTYSPDQCNFSYRSSLFKTDLKDRIFITHVTFTLQKYTPETYTPLMSYGAIQEQLSKENNITPSLLAQTIADIRASKLPDRTQIGTAGSFFKNPIITKEIYTHLIAQHPAIKGYPTTGTSYKLSAGQLIDLSGLKGITQGAVGTYKNHALVLVNHGGGTGKQLTDLAKYIQTTVYTTFGIKIEPEVNYI